jgi:hypothetical protein
MKLKGIGQKTYFSGPVDFCCLSETVLVLKTGETLANIPAPQEPFAVLS